MIHATDSQGSLISIYAGKADEMTRWPELLHQYWAHLNNAFRSSLPIQPSDPASCNSRKARSNHRPINWFYFKCFLRLNIKLIELKA